MSLLPCHLPQATTYPKEGSDENNILILMDNPLKQCYDTYVNREIRKVPVMINKLVIQKGMFDFYPGLPHFMISGFVRTYRAQSKVAFHSKQQSLVFTNNKLSK